MNGKIKRQYIADNCPTSSTAKLISSFFRRMEPLESEVGKDLAAVTLSELMKYLGDYGYLSYFSLKNDLYAIKRYMTWCREKLAFGADYPYGNIDNIIMYDIDISCGIQKELIASEDHLCELVADSLGVKSVGLEKSLLVFLWMGLTYNEILSLTTDDVSVVDGVLTVDLGHSVLTLSHDGLVGIVEHYLVWLSKYYSPSEDNHIIRIKVADKRTKARYLKAMITNYCTLISPHSDSTLNGAKIVMSGRLRRTYLHECESGIVEYGFLMKEFGYKDVNNRISDLLRFFYYYKKAFYFKGEF